MKSNKNTAKRIKTMRWVARVWSTLTFLLGMILFVSLIIDASNEPPTSIYWWLSSLWFASVLGLMLGWRWERAGGIIALTSLISRELMYYFLSGQILVEFWMVWLPILPPAVLFMETWRLENKMKNAQLPREVFD